MIELYEFPLSGNCHKVRLMLSLLGLEYRSVPLRGSERKHKQPEFLALNPFGQVPVLVDAGFAVRDSQAILVYLARRYGGPAWWPDDAQSLAAVTSWLFTSANEIARGPNAARLHRKFGRPLDYGPLPRRGVNAYYRDARPVNLASDTQKNEDTTVNQPIEPRPPFPPFTPETAAQKVRLAEDAWNSRDPQRVALAYTPDSEWRNRAEFPTGREQIIEFLTRKWARELDYRLIKELWACSGDRIAVRFAYEWRDDSGHWFRSYGNENWAFDAQGLMRRRYASINDLPITEAERKFHWPLGRRPDDHPGLSQLGL